MTIASSAPDSNNLSKVRTALAGVTALQVQTMGQRRRRAHKAPGIA